mmetsp:Transcript_86444/g.135293  ORF Transcript_86444/g.135293 Transcript_86444/m.135293 type:complete len:228 (+) Transcript_86444:86-769(+)|eukprot:CAMPEP_0169367110 /NCGR_PEP_ID=MMETSP1017-20121227/33489_1 /TAXON_ID=342587 /ORGANISM="Karlodinium micrum, Strain CCMP2283" /LENGTH=227 /DNA_ID=CAMNT_0009465119 /DNA_START=57 /DNA_END=740 /DNA_ORIENTATION=+
MALQFASLCVFYGVFQVISGIVGVYIHQLLEKEVCGHGYVEQPGDLPHHGFKLPGNLDAENTFECADKCDRTEQCLSYEFSPQQKKCNLNKEMEPAGPPFQDYHFCSRKAYHSLYAGLAVLASMVVCAGLAICDPRLPLTFGIHPAFAHIAGFRLALLCMLASCFVFPVMAFNAAGDRRVLFIIMEISAISALVAALRLEFRRLGLVEEKRGKDASDLPGPKGTEQK